MTRTIVQGVRMIGRRPLVTLTSIMCLAVGIGACAVSWTLIDAVLIRPYGLRDVNRLVVLTEADASRNQPFIEVSYLNFVDWQREARTVESMAAFGSQHWPALAKVGSEMLPLTTRGVSTTFFPMLDVAPMLGRNFERQDADAAQPPPIILSHRLWQSRFGGAASIVGQNVFLDGSNHLVIGVMPAGFAFPDDPDAWVSVERVLGEALDDLSVEQQRLVGVLEVLSRRRAGMSNDDVRVELTEIARALQRRHSSASASPTIAVAVTPFANAIVGRLGQRLWIALGMSVAVLLIACTNVAAARSAQLKERSVALTTRLFLGATRTRLAFELAFETVPIVVLGAIASGVVWLLLIDALAPSTSISASGITLRDRWAGVMGWLAAGAVISWWVVGVCPASAAATRTVESVGGSLRVVARTSRVGAPLIFGQAAVAIVVVALAGAAVQTFQRLSSIDLGFSTRGVTLVDFSLPEWKYRSVAAQRVTVNQLQARLREMPEATHVAAVSVRPFRFGEVVDGVPVRRTGDVARQPQEATPASRVAVTPAYFEALGQPVVEGREFTAFDQENAPPVAIVSRTLARALFGDRPVVGEQVDVFTLTDKWKPRVIVGVAGDAQYRGLERPSLEVYVPVTQTQTSIGSLVIGSTARLSEPTIRNLMRQVEPDIAIEGLQTTAELRASVLGPARLLMTIVLLLASAGALLLALGIFASAAVALRVASGEMAVRQAVGARPLQAARAPLRVLARALFAGIIAGGFMSPIALLAAAALGLSASGNRTIPIVVATVVVVAVAAIAIVPTLYRAARRPPAQLLRSEVP